MPVRRAALVLRCPARLQDGLVKAPDFPGAVAEMAHFGRAPAATFARAVVISRAAARRR